MDHYNATARALKPPHTTLKWDDVVKYAFLSDFDLLSNTQQDIHTHPWSTHTALDTHFKICGAYVELEHLNIEIMQILLIFVMSICFYVAKQMNYVPPISY